jgi:NAD(P)-dependent dehydrogenase (short-subunit alcohol dehydrogenase family)
MRRAGGGKIVNVAGGGVGGNGVAPRVSAYTTSKGAVAQFTESLAREVAEANVQVNCISPGAVVTEMTAAVVAAGPEKAGKELYERTLAQRSAGGESPELAARLIVWLASDESGKLTGKLFSAKWDNVQELDVEATNKSPMYTLRRIDGAMFAEKK